jgi:hypothetical protein
MHGGQDVTPGERHPQLDHRGDGPEAVADGGQ